jgi:hypothetical protein
MVPMGTAKTIHHDSCQRSLIVQFSFTYAHTISLLRLT